MRVAATCVRSRASAIGPAWHSMESNNSHGSMSTNDIHEVTKHVRKPTWRSNVKCEWYGCLSGRIDHCDCSLVVGHLDGVDACDELLGANAVTIRHVSTLHATHDDSRRCRLRPQSDADVVHFFLLETHGDDAFTAFGWIDTKRGESDEWLSACRTRSLTHIHPPVGTPVADWMSTRNDSALRWFHACHTFHRRPLRFVLFEGGYLVHIIFCFTATYTHFFTALLFRRVLFSFTDASPNDYDTSRTPRRRSHPHPRSAFVSPPM